jgi:hypothetical protein
VVSVLREAVVFHDPSVIGDWSELGRRLESGGVLARWAAAEPALASAVSLEQLQEWVSGSSRDRVDEVLGALVRLAAVDGGNDCDAVLVVLHLLSDGVTRLAFRLRDLAVDVVPLVVGELTVQIRTFPWRRRTRAVAANLLLDTKAALWRELGTGRSRRRGGGGQEVLVDPLDQRTVARLLDGGTQRARDDGPRLAEVLVWAVRTGVAAADDVMLLVELACRDVELRAWSLRDLDVYGIPIDSGPLTQRDVASRLRITERTLRRRRDRTLAALTEAGNRYLRAIA